MVGACRILHVEDDPAFADLTQTVLGRVDERVEIEHAADGTSGLETFESRAFDCIVSDFDMPDISGIELLERVRERDPDIPFILFTGKGSEEVAAEAIHAGATDYLQKKGDSSQYTVLANRIENAVGHYRAKKRNERIRKRHEETLEYITDGYVEFDTDLVITEVNQQAVEYADADSPRDLIGRTFDELVATENSELIPVYREVIETGEPKTLAVRSDIHPDRWVRERVFPAEDGIFVFFTDITEERERERRLDRRTRRFEALFNNPLVYVGLMDPDGTTLDFNESVIEVNELPKDALLDKPLWEMPWWPDDSDTAERLRSAFDRVRSGEAIQLETPYLLADRSRGRLKVALTPVIDGDAVTEVVAFGLAMTDEDE